MSAAAVLEKELKLLLKYVKKEVGRALAFGEYGNGFLWAVADLTAAVVGVLQNAYEMETAKPRSGRRCLDVSHIISLIYEAREALHFYDLHPAAFGYGHALHIYFDVFAGVLQNLPYSFNKTTKCVEVYD
jgi:hypothetical protein